MEKCSLKVGFASVSKYNYESFGYLFLRPSNFKFGMAFIHDIKVIKRLRVVKIKTKYLLFKIQSIFGEQN